MRFDEVIHMNVCVTLNNREKKEIIFIYNKKENKFDN